MRSSIIHILLNVCLISALVFGTAIKESSEDHEKPALTGNKENVIKHPNIVEGEPNIIANEVPERDPSSVVIKNSEEVKENEVKNENPKDTPVSNEANNESKVNVEETKDEQVEVEIITEYIPTNVSQEAQTEEKVSYEGVQVVRVVFKNKEQRKCLKQLQESGDINTWVGNGTATDILIRADSREKVYRMLQEKQLTYDMVIEDLQKAIDEENPQLSEDEWSELQGRNVDAYSYRTKIYGDGSHMSAIGLRYYNNLEGASSKKIFNKPRTQHRKGHRLTWQLYHRMNDIHGYLDFLANTYPQMCSVQTIGHSVEGRPLKLLKISSGQPNSPAIWVDSGIHAREWITPASSTYVINQLVEGGGGPQGIDWYFLPLVNPDGYEHTHVSDRLWRKNRANPSKGRCAGTDLNRNFGYRWGGQGASRQPCRETYAGTGPFSEPETSAINQFVTSKQGQIKAYVSLHSYGQYILYPWGYDRKVPPDYADLDRVGRRMSQAMRQAGGGSYTVGSAAATLYPASGGSDDWAKGSAKIKYAYTIELRDTGRHGFVLPASYIVPTAKEAHAALTTLASEVQQLSV